jgi:predicted RNA-binding Zn-ribbon protein involved in translation (DUF1610 family)
VALDTGRVAVAVTTTCPSCTGPLEFPEGTNALRCGACGSQLLVTGRRRVVSYVVRHEVDAARAVAIAREGAAGGGLAAELWYVPYYRFTGLELRWEREPSPSAGRGGPADPRWLASWPIAFAIAGSEAPELFASPRIEGDWRARADTVRIGSRRIERSIAAAATAIAPPSLGLRSGQLRVSLLREDALPRTARVVACAVEAAAAFRQAIGSERRDELLRREVVARVLSLLYYPLWMVRAAPTPGGTVVVVDGCSGAIACAGATPGELPALADASTPLAGAQGLRPHVCPNCGNDLAVQPRDVVFSCDSCERAWLSEGDRLEPVRFAVAAAPPRISEREVAYRPFWEVARGRERRLVPAFRHASLARLRQLATALSRRADRLDFGAGGGHGLRALSGCEIDPTDAAAIAGFFASADRSPHRPPANRDDLAEIAPADARLLWLPLVRDVYGWREPTTGIALLPPTGGASERASAGGPDASTLRPSARTKRS